MMHTDKDSHVDGLVEEVDGESNLQGAGPHHVDKEAGVNQLLAVHVDQVHDFSGWKQCASKVKLLFH